MHILPSKHRCCISFLDDVLNGIGQVAKPTGHPWLPSRKIGFDPRLQISVDWTLHSFLTTMVELPVSSLFLDRALPLERHWLALGYQVLREICSSMHPGEFTVSST